MYTHEMNKCLECTCIEWMFTMYIHWINVYNAHTLNECLQCTIHTLSECVQCTIYMH